ncbi:MAG TPA: YihY/virulence factor BrkB family protein [Bacillota bacterium]|nr:YihY/virulence factor BrkB family protein [Bacillota bacterium]
MNKFIHFIKALMASFKKNNTTLLGAAQAYHYLLMIVPLLIVSFAIIPYLNLNPDDVLKFIGEMIPEELASIFESTIIHLVETPKGGLLTFGIIAALWSASSGLVAFMKATNTAYNVEETRSFLKVRLIATVLTIGMILSILVAFLFVIFGNVIIEWVQSFIDIRQPIYTMIQVTRWLASVTVMTVVLMMMYRFAPNKKIPFKHIIPGAVTTSLLWIIASLGFSFYIGNFANFSATYGSLGGMIILMIWFYLTGILLMVGAEINVILHEEKQVEE